MNKTQKLSEEEVLGLARKVSNWATTTDFEGERVYIGSVDGVSITLFKDSSFLNSLFFMGTRDFYHVSVRCDGIKVGSNAFLKDVGLPLYNEAVKQVQKRYDRREESAVSHARNLARV